MEDSRAGPCRLSRCEGKPLTAFRRPVVWGTESMSVMDTLPISGRPARERHSQKSILRGTDVVALEVKAMRGTSPSDNEEMERSRAMTNEHLTGKLAEQVMGWRIAPDRYLKRGRGWIRKWRFAPFTRIEDAFDLLDRAASDYTLTSNAVGAFTAEVRVNGKVGRASGANKATTISLAISRALGLEAPE